MGIFRPGSSHFISLTIRQLSHMSSRQHCLILLGPQVNVIPVASWWLTSSETLVLLFRLLWKTFCSKRWRVIVSSLSFQPNNADSVHICNPASLSADFNGWLTHSFISWLNLTRMAACQDWWSVQMLNCFAWPLTGTVVGPAKFTFSLSNVTSSTENFLISCISNCGKPDRTLVTIDSKFCKKWRQVLKSLLQPGLLFSVV